MGFLKKLLKKTVRVVGSTFPGPQWLDSDFRQGAREDLRQTFGDTIGGALSRMEPSQLAQMVNPDEAAGESRQRGLSQAMQMAIMAAAGGGHIPQFAKPTPGTAGSGFGTIPVGQSNIRLMSQARGVARAATQPLDQSHQMQMLRQMAEMQHRQPMQRPIFQRQDPNEMLRRMYGFR